MAVRLKIMQLGGKGWFFRSKKIFPAEMNMRLCLFFGMVVFAYAPEVANLPSCYPVKQAQVKPPYPWIKASENAPFSNNEINASAATALL